MKWFNRDAQIQGELRLFGRVPLGELHVHHVLPLHRPDPGRSRLPKTERLQVALMEAGDHRLDDVLWRRHSDSWDNG